MVTLPNEILTADDVVSKPTEKSPAKNVYNVKRGVCSLGVGDFKLVVFDVEGVLVPKNRYCCLRFVGVWVCGF
jgi:hypothetical protein